MKCYRVNCVCFSKVESNCCSKVKNRKDCPFYLNKKEALVVYGRELEVAKINYKMVKSV